MSVPGGQTVSPTVAVPARMIITSVSEWLCAPMWYCAGTSVTCRYGSPSSPSVIRRSRIGLSSETGVMSRSAGTTMVTLIYGLLRALGARRGGDEPAERGDAMLRHAVRHRRDIMAHGLGAQRSDRA